MLSDLDTHKKGGKGKQPSVACHEQTSLDGFLSKEEKPSSNDQNMQTDNLDSDALDSEQINKQGLSAFSPGLKSSQLPLYHI